MIYDEYCDQSLLSLQPINGKCLDIHFYWFVDFLVYPLATLEEIGVADFHEISG